MRILWRQWRQYSAISGNVQSVAIIVKVAVVTSWFLSHLHHLVDVQMRWGTPTPTLPRKRMEGAIGDRPDNYFKGYGDAMGYILEEHFVTLSRCWR